MDRLLKELEESIDRHALAKAKEIVAELKERRRMATRPSP